MLNEKSGDNRNKKMKAQVQEEARHYQKELTEEIDKDRSENRNAACVGQLPGDCGRFPLHAAGQGNLPKTRGDH